ncbi:MAG: hypothetical protein Q8Q00_03155 [Dehalococcoidia bacterium]|nr:hypothetical protein [Dehalococcoidia bacterium]
MSPNEDQGSASARSQAVRALAVIEEHVLRAGDAIEHDLAEKDVFKALSALRGQVTALELGLVKSRLEHFRGGADEGERARATEVLDLLESRRETRLQDAEVSLCPSGSRKGSGR